MDARLTRRRRSLKDAPDPLTSMIYQMLSENEASDREALAMAEGAVAEIRAECHLLGDDHAGAVAILAGERVADWLEDSIRPGRRDLKLDGPAHGVRLTVGIALACIYAGLNKIDWSWIAWKYVDRAYASRTR